MITKPRGTKDSFGPTYLNYQAMIERIIHLFKKYNFQPWATPIFESQDLFVSSVGETSDIVSKEMYLFQDRNQRFLVLRPEGTAPIVRALIENKLFGSSHLPLKIFYSGPMFRYERPQVGRSRQFDQLGVEVFGPAHLYQDLEIMRLIKDLINQLALEKDVFLEINYLVGAAHRARYVNDLKKECKRIKDLCDLCHVRLVKNPLRILDCKEDQSKFNQLPQMVNYLSSSEQDYWNQFQEGLKEIGLKWRINHHLVRGLDYYTGLIFELKTTNPILKAQNTFLAGGRYNSLVHKLGGPDLAAIGFAIGSERLFELLQTVNPDLFLKPRVDFYVWAKNAPRWKDVDHLITTLRHFNFSVASDFSAPDLKRAYRQAEQINAQTIILFGSESGNRISWKKLFQNKLQEDEISKFLEIVIKENK